MPLPASLTLSALKKRVGKELSTDDTLLEELLEGALKQAQAPAPLGTGRTLLPEPEPVLGEGEKDESVPVTKTTRVRGRHVAVPDARDIVSVTLDGVTLGESEYETLEQDGVAVRITICQEPFASYGSYGDGYGYGDYGSEGFYDRWRRRRRRTVAITGRFGFAELPIDLRNAIYTLAARAYYEREAQYADQVAIAEGTGVQTYFRQLPPAVKLAFANYTLPTGLIGLS